MSNAIDNKPLNDQFYLKKVVPTGGIRFSGDGAKDTTANLQIENISAVSPDADFDLPIQWKGKDVIVRLPLLDADRTITIDVTDGWLDGDWVNLIIDLPNTGGFGLLFDST